jgi:hypothetical protein
VVQSNQVHVGFDYDKSGISPYVHVSRQDVMDELEHCFENNPDALARSCHASVDAEALRYAFVLVAGP